MSHKVEKKKEKKPQMTKTLKRTSKMLADPCVLIASRSHTLQGSSHSAYQERGAVVGKNLLGSLVALHFLSLLFALCEVCRLSPLDPAWEMDGSQNITPLV